MENLHHWHDVEKSIYYRIELKDFGQNDTVYDVRNCERKKWIKYVTEVHAVSEILYL